MHLTVVDNVVIQTSFGIRIKNQSSDATVLRFHAQMKVSAFIVKFFKATHSDGFCRSILAPLQFNMKNTSIGKVYYHFAKNLMHVGTGRYYCQSLGFGVDLPMPKEISNIDEKLCITHT